VSERVYEPYEKANGRYWCWYKVGAGASDVERETFDALGLPSSQTVAAYPTREAALAALDAARAKVGGVPDAAAELAAACESGLAFVRHTLEFFGWAAFPNLERSAEELRDKLAAALARYRGASS
jgi:ABC-type amino acid transport substrate-binding protein